MHKRGRITGEHVSQRASAKCGYAPNWGRKKKVALGLKRKRKDHQSFFARPKREREKGNDVGLGRQEKGNAEP